MPSRQHRVGRNHPELLLAGQSLFAQRVPARVEATVVPVRPLDRNVVRGMGGTRGVVDEERFVRHQRLLLADPPDRSVGHVLGEVVALLRSGLRLHGRGALIDPRVVLVGLPADEAVEVLESTAASGPRVERSHRTGLPDRHLMTFAELGSRVAVLPQCQRQRCTRVRPDRTVTGRRRGQFRHDSHPHRVMVATAQQRGPGRGAQRRRVESVVLQASRTQPFGGGRAARATERARRAEPHIIKQHHKHVRRASRRTQRGDRRERNLHVPHV